MVVRLLLAVLLLGTVPALAQPTVVPDCTADVTLHEALTLDVAYHCRSSQPLSFASEGERAQPFVSNFAGGRIEAVNGLVEAQQGDQQQHDGKRPDQRAHRRRGVLEYDADH